MEKKSFDLINFRNYKLKEESLKKDIQEQEKTIRTSQGLINIYNQILDEQESLCNHDLLLHLGKEEISDKDTGTTFCLTCGRLMYITDEARNRANVIDVEGIIAPEYLCAYDNDKNILVTRAMIKLLSLSFTKGEMSLEEIKANILEDLVYYTDELSYRKIIPRKRTRIISERKN